MEDEIYETDTQILSLAGSGNICLCDDYACPTIIAGATYRSVRHAVLSLKTENKNFKKDMADMLPADLKSWERSIHPSPYWDKEFVIKNLKTFTLQKFKNYPKVKEKLILTYPKIIKNGLIKGQARFDIDEVCDENNIYGIILMEIRMDLM